MVLLFGGASIGMWLYLHRSVSPVPKSIQKSVSFPIYYPEQAKLPAGYNLDLRSFKNPVPNGISYIVRYSNGNKLVFSLQEKPSDSELQSFNANYIPLRNEVHTNIGLAEIGAYSKQGKVETLVSLPTNSPTWIIITAPYNINQDQLKEILKSFKH